MRHWPFGIGAPATDSPRRDPNARCLTPDASVHRIINPGGIPMRPPEPSFFIIFCMSLN